MRVWDGFLTMLGLGERVPATRRELNELRAEWREYQLELGGLLDQLNRAAGRWAKREAREATKAAAELAAPPPDPALMHMPHLLGAKDRKAELRRRMAAGQLTRNRITTTNGEGAE